MLKPKEIRKQSPKEREKKLHELKTELAREQAAVASGTRPENPGRIKELRRAIARILTIQKENPKIHTQKKDKKREEAESKK